MHIIKRALILAFAALLLVSASAMAAEEILSKTLEDSYSVETGSDTLSIRKALGSPDRHGGPATPPAPMTFAFSPKPCVLRRTGRPPF